MEPWGTPSTFFWPLIECSKWFECVYCFLWHSRWTSHHLLVRCSRSEMLPPLQFERRTLLGQAAGRGWSSVPRVTAVSWGFYCREGTLSSFLERTSCFIALVTPFLVLLVWQPGHERSRFPLGKAGRRSKKRANGAKRQYHNNSHLDFERAHVDLLQIKTVFNLQMPLKTRWSPNITRLICWERSIQ